MTRGRPRKSGNAVPVPRRTVAPTAATEVDSSELPEGWTAKTLGDVGLNITGGGTPSRHVAEYFGGHIVWLTPTEIPKERIRVVRNSRETLTMLGLQKSSARIVPEGSVLLTSRASIGNVAIAGCPVTTNQGFACFECNDNIYNWYLAYWLWASKNLLEDEASGTTFKEISKAKLRELTIPLPSYPQQERIVAKVEELLGRIDTTRNRLTRVPQLLKKFRQAVLTNACTGKLTEDWRSENGMDSIDDKGPPTVWKVIPFGEVVSNFDGKRIPLKSDDRALRQGNYPYYGATGVIDSIDGFLFEGKYLLVSEDGANLTYRTYPIAFIAMGQFWVNNHAHIVVAKDITTNEFLRIFLNSIDLQDYITGSAQPKLTQANLNKIPVFIPPIEEQHEIVRRVEQLFTYADKIQQQVNNALARVDRTTQAVLSKAFKGELVK